MRILSTALFTITFLSLHYSQTITDVTPWIPPYNFNSVSFLDDNTGWMTSEENKLFKTTDAGLTWDSVSNTPPLNKVFPFSEYNLIGQGTLGYTYYSEDGGINWSQISYPAGFIIYTSYAVDFNTIFAAGPKETILKTTDRGLTWIIVHINTSSLKTFDNIEFINNQYGWAACFVYNDGRYLYRTTDGGNTWIQINAAFPANNFKFSDSLTGYGGNDGSVYKTTDGGITWVLVHYLPDQTRFVALDVMGNSIYYSEGMNCNSNGSPYVIYSTDGGMNWSTTNYALGNFRINDLHIFSNAKVFICGEKGYIAKTDQSNNFRGLNGDYINNIFALPNKVYAIDKEYLYVITENGTSWEKLPSPYAGLNASILFTDPLKGFIIAGSQISRTTDGGHTWTALPFVASSLKMIKGMNSVILYNTTGIYKSSDMGDTWSFFSLQGGKSFSFLDSNTGWVSSADSLYKTTDQGISWNYVAPFTQGYYFRFVTPDSGWVMNAFNFYYTNNGGLTWNLDHEYNYFGAYPMNIYYTGPGSVFYAGAMEYLPCDETLYRSYFVWTSNYETTGYKRYISKGNNDFSFSDDHHGWLNGGRKLYRIDNQTVSVEVIIKAPEEYVLYQNYPNPFNPITLIRYAVPSAGQVTLTVTDILGNEVKTLVNEFRSPGNYETEFSASNLASGIYFYTLSAGTFRETKKLLYLK